MADILLEPRLVVNTQAGVVGQASPAMSQSITGSYAAGQTLNQTLVLRAGQQYSPGIGFSNLVINTTGPIQLLAAKGSNATFINQTVTQQTTIDDAADSFTITNNGTVSVTVQMLILVAPNASTTPTGVVTSLNSMIGNINIEAGPGISVVNGTQTITINNTGVFQVNGQTGNVTINAENLPGLSTVALTGKYSDLIGAPAAYVLPVATASVLGGIKVGSGLSITQDGTLSVSSTGHDLVTSVDGQVGDVIVKATDNGAAGSQSLIADSGATTGNIILNRLAVAGSGLAINTLNGVTTITSSGLQGAVLSVDGQHPDSNGNVVVQAVDNAAGTGVSLITNSGATTGNLTFKKLVAGANIGITQDGNGNILVVGTVTPYTLPVATSTVLGGVKQGAGVAIAPDGTISIASSYILPVATPTILGGVKIGSNVNVTADGTISVAAPYVLPMASATTLGGIKVGANLNLDQDGTLWANPPFNLVPATATILGGVKIGANVSVTSDGTISVADPYTLPKASTIQLGGIIVGNNLTIDSNGVLSAIAGSYVLPKATTTTLGGIIVGNNLTIDGTGKLSATAAPYTLPVATASVLGGVKQGAGITIAGDGTISTSVTLPIATFSVLGAVKIGANVAVAGDGTISVAPPYVLPTASSTVLGGIKVGNNLSIDGNGVLSATAAPYTLPVATTTVLGGVKQGSGVTIAGDGTISVAAYTLPTASATVLGGIKVGTNLSIDGNGVLSATATPYTLPVATASVLGGVKAGTGVSIAGDGTLSVTGTAPVTSVSGQVGAVVIKAQSANPQSGTQSIIVNSGATTGVITTRDLVAGTGTTIAPDSNGNLLISSAGLVSSVSGQIGAVVVQAVDKNTSTGLSLISDSGATTGTIKLLRLVAGANVTLGPDSAGNILIDTPTPTAPYVLPIASGTTLGGVKIGANISIAGDGTISVATPYTLPVASATILGGVKQGSGVSIAGDGTISVSGVVTSVNGISGAVTVSTTDANTASGVTLISNDGSTTGQAKLLRLVAGTNITLTNDVNGNVQIAAAGGSGSLPIATASVLGGVKIGANVNVAGDGTISVAAPYTLPVATTSVLGGVKAGTGLAVAGDGTLSVTGVVTSVSGQSGTVVVSAANNNAATGTTLISDSGATTGTIKLKTIVAGTNVTLSADTNSNLVISSAIPIASASVLGGVKQGAGVSIAGDGTISVTATAPVTSVSGQTGAVVVSAVDNNAATGTTLIASSGSTTGTIKLKTIVAGTNISLAADGNGNLIVNNTQAAYILPAATTSTLGGVKAGTGLAVAADGTLSTTVNTNYDIQAGTPGTVNANQVLGLVVLVRTVTIPANFAGSFAYALTPAAATTTVFTVSTIVSGTTTNIGTITFNTGSNSGVFSSSTQQVLAPGSVVTVTSGATIDTTLSGVTMTLLGQAS